MYLDYVEIGEIWFSNNGVYDVMMCSAGVDHCSGISLVTFARGGTARHSAMSNQVSFISIRYRAGEGRHCYAWRATG